MLRYEHTYFSRNQTIIGITKDKYEQKQQQKHKLQKSEKLSPEAPELLNCNLISDRKLEEGKNTINKNKNRSNKGTMDFKNQ